MKANSQGQGRGVLRLVFNCVLGIDDVRGAPEFNFEEELMNRL